MVYRSSGIVVITIAAASAILERRTLTDIEA